MKTKKINIQIFGIIVGALFLLPLTVSAASVSFTPSSVNGEAGDRTVFDVVIEPQGDTVYTVSLEIDYPEGLVNFGSFQQADGWLPLTQEGYDRVDRSNGIIIKTAGFPGGVSTPKKFGSITFTSARSGTNSISATNNTKIFDANNANVAEGFPVAASVSYSKPREATPTQIETAESSSGSVEREGGSSETAQEDNIATETATSVGTTSGTTTQDQDQTAAVTDAVTELPWLLLLVITLAALTLTFALLWIRERKRSRVI